MKKFAEIEWKSYSDRLRGSAQYYAGNDASLQTRFAKQAEEFIQQNAVENYGELRRLMTKASSLVMSWRSQSSVVGDRLPNQSPAIDD